MSKINDSSCIATKPKEITDQSSHLYARFILITSVYDA